MNFNNNRLIHAVRRVRRPTQSQMRSYAIVFKLVLVGVLAFGTNPVRADSVRISQIDARSLLPTQQVRAYVSVLDAQGEPLRGLNADNFRVLESADGEQFEETDLIDVTRLDQSAEGIDFLLLIDNSGSMYQQRRDENGRPYKRIDHAREAVRSFVTDMPATNDRVALVSYNTKYVRHVDFTGDRTAVLAGLTQMRQPFDYDHFSEIYAALVRAIHDVGASGGRKVIVILSDGENRSYYAHLHQEHPDYGSRIYTPDEPLDLARREGLSIYTVNYGTSRYQRDKMLQQISLDTGGAVFDARNADELKNIYRTIARQVSGEYRLTARATMIPADRRFMRIEYNAANTGTDTVQATRRYFTGTVLGMPLRELTPLLILPLLLALLLLALLSRWKFEQKEHAPQLEVLNAGAAGSV
ncbi:MAG: VWA domain-containing protein, partial [Leptospiraceae bacterium]|nr:VWA domain-containing protein [Leptospiraceae bacterium]